MKNYHHIKPAVTAGRQKKLRRNCQGRRKLWGRPKQVKKPRISLCGPRDLRGRVSEWEDVNPLLGQLCCQSEQIALQGTSSSGVVSASSHAFRLIAKLLQGSVPSTLLQRCIYAYFCHFVLPHKNIHTLYSKSIHFTHFSICHLRSFYSLLHK